MKIFLLAVMAGLRRNEIDKLDWTAFHWDKGLIRIETTSVFQAKTEDSLGDVEIDSEMMEIFRGYRARAKGEFVIESSVAARPEANYGHYRCQRDFKALTKWLREHGVTGNTPLHSLRKEFGSRMCATHGIYAASHALRHGDILITSAHYLDKKRRATVGMGHLLTGDDKVIQIGKDAAIKPKPTAKKAVRRA
jgi:integrase